MRDSGKNGPEDTLFHLEIIKQLCSDEIPIKVIRTSYLLLRYQSQRLGNLESQNATLVASKSQISLLRA